MTKINKAIARKMWNNGEEFIMVACNMRPEYGIRIRNENGRNFEQMYNTFRYYNCNTKTGYYPAFYVNP